MKRGESIIAQGKPLSGAALGVEKKKKIEPGATERQRRSVGRQIKARTVAKRPATAEQASAARRGDGSSEP